MNPRNYFSLIYHDKCHLPEKTEMEVVQQDANNATVLHPLQASSGVPQVHHSRSGGNNWIYHALTLEIARCCWTFSRHFYVSGIFLRGRRIQQIQLTVSAGTQWFQNETYSVNWKGKASNYCIICANEDETIFLKWQVNCKRTSR